MAITYKDAGVDIDAGAELVEQIKPLVAKATRPEVLAGLGGFAGLCALPERYSNPILVSGTDGVGTKLKTAFATGRHGTVGIDLVAMVVNDIAVLGAEPLFFLDYFATGALDVPSARDVIAGIAKGCIESNCALVGGETAELPGMYNPAEYDLAGFAVGVVERDAIRDGRDIVAGDAVIGLPSAGLHANGHSLARKAILDVLGLNFAATPTQLGAATVADALLEPTRIYVNAMAALRDNGPGFKGAAHITGGGLIENPPRALPNDELAVRLDPNAWSVPGVFDLIASAGVEEAEMRRTFNMGLGMVVFVAATDADAAVTCLREAGEEARVVGEVCARDSGEAVRFS